jgi:hypothetical protein
MEHENFRKYKEKQEYFITVTVSYEMRLEKNNLQKTLAIGGGRAII